MAVFKVRRYKNDDFPSAVGDGDFLISKSTGHASFDIKSVRVPLRGRNQELSDFQSSAVQKSTDFSYGVRYKFNSSEPQEVPSDDKALTEAAAAKRFTYAASGISSSTPITSYGWKRVAILSRKMSGTVGLCFESNKAQAGVVRHNVLISYQGVTDYPTADANAHAKRYPGKNKPNVTIISNKVSGENQDVVMPCRRIRIQAVRIAYPSYSKADSDAGKYPSSGSGPVACYLDVFVGSGDFDAVMPSGGIASSALSVNLMGDTLTSVDGDQFALLTDKEYNATDVGIKGEALNLDSVYLVLDRYNSLDS